jgi:hypothetical protein
VLIVFAIGASFFGRERVVAAAQPLREERILLAGFVRIDGSPDSTMPISLRFAQP